MIDLRPLWRNGPALDIILLARGQLNRAFRQKGLIPPDPLPLQPGACTETRDLDDPARRGIAYARKAYGEDFAEWSAGIPDHLLSPVLAILGQTLAAMNAASAPDPTAKAAVEDACDYLLRADAS